MKAKIDVWIKCYKCGAEKRFVGNPEGTTICFKCGRTLKVRKCMRVRKEQAETPEFIVFKQV